MFTEITTVDCETEYRRIESSMLTDFQSSELIQFFYSFLSIICISICFTTRIKRKRFSNISRELKVKKIKYSGTNESSNNIGTN